MTLIIAVGRNMKWIMTLNHCLVLLEKILDIIYTYGSLKQPMAKNILLRFNHIFIYQRMLFSIVNKIYEYYEARSAISLFRINELFSHPFVVFNSKYSIHATYANQFVFPIFLMSTS